MEKYKALEAENERLTKQLSERDEIIKAVAHIGIDFGYGKYELEEKFIDMARAALPQEDV